MTDPVRVGELLPAGTHHRLDELPIGVLIRTLDELGQVLPPIGGFVVGAIDVIGTDRIVPRLDDVERIEVHAHCFKTVAQRDGFSHRLRLAKAAANIESRCAQLMGCINRR